MNLSLRTRAITHYPLYSRLIPHNRIFYATYLMVLTKSPHTLLLSLSYFHKHIIFCIALAQSHFLFFFSHRKLTITPFSSSILLSFACNPTFLCYFPRRTLAIIIILFLPISQSAIIFLFAIAHTIAPFLSSPLQAHLFLLAPRRTLAINLSTSPTSYPCTHLFRFLFSLPPLTIAQFSFYFLFIFSKNHGFSSPP